MTVFVDGFRWLQFVAAGKIRSIGIGNFTVGVTKNLLETAKLPSAGLSVPSSMRWVRLRLRDVSRSTQFSWKCLLGPRELPNWEIENYVIDKMPKKLNIYFQLQCTLSDCHTTRSFRTNKSGFWKSCHHIESAWTARQLYEPKRSRKSGRSKAADLVAGPARIIPTNRPGAFPSTPPLTINHQITIRWPSRCIETIPRERGLFEIIRHATDQRR